MKATLALIVAEALNDRAAPSFRSPIFFLGLLCCAALPLSPQRTRGDPDSAATALLVFSLVALGPSGLTRSGFGGKEGSHSLFGFIDHFCLFGVSVQIEFLSGMDAPPIEAIHLMCDGL